MARRLRPRFVRTPRVPNPLLLPQMPTMQEMPRMPRFPGFPVSPMLVPVKDARSVRAVTRRAIAQGDIPPQPEWWQGSDIEWLVYWWLTAHGIQFEYLTEFRGGRASQSLYDGQEIDFVVTDGGRKLAIGVHGEYFHYRTTRLTQRELLRKTILLAEGFEVVFVRGSDLQSHLNETMEAALEGRQSFSDL